MNIVVTYGIDKDLYDNSEHRVSLVTTEYTYRSDMLVHLQIGKNLGIRLNNLLNHDFKTDTVFPNEQFLFKKAYKQGKAKPITRSTFEDKMKRFDMNRTVTEREILEEYADKGKDGLSDEVQIVIRVKDDEMIAVIDFKDVEQHMWTQVIDPEYCFWTSGVIYKLIKNEVYIGKAVSNKLQVTEPGRNHTAPRPKDEWIIVPNAHEPLVSESDFQKAQLVLAKQIYFGKPEHIFGNKVKCPSCGHAMIRHTRQNPRFKCGTAKLTDHYGCRVYTILQSEIEKAVITSVRAYAAMIINREQMMMRGGEKEWKLNLQASLNRMPVRK